MKTTISMHEFAGAIRKNGLTQYFGNLYLLDFESKEKFPKNIKAACAIGQAQINLGGEVFAVEEYDSILSDIARMNDDDHASFTEIADYIEKSYPKAKFFLVKWDDNVVQD